MKGPDRRANRTDNRGFGTKRGERERETKFKSQFHKILTELRDYSSKYPNQSSISCNMHNLNSFLVDDWFQKSF